MRTLGTSRACIPHSRAGRKRSRTVPRTAARCVLICWIVVLGCLATACSQGSSVKQAASSLASSKGVTVTPTPPAATTPAATATAPPSTATVTAPATTAPAPAVATPATATPTGASESGSSLVWLWVALAAAAVVVIALIAWIVSAGRRRTTARADGRTRLIDAYAKGSALHDAMVAAEAPGMLSSADAAVRWSDIQRRADDFGQTLYRLRESAADEDGVRIEAVLASLQAARSAMEAERSGQYAAGAMSDVVRDRLSSFMAALQDLREPRVRPA